MHRLVRRSLVRLLRTSLLAALLTGAPLSTARGDDAPAAPTPPSAPEVPAENPYPGRFPAPSLDGGVEWLNTAGEIRLQDLRGKIVLLDFWTYCCINCIHVLPDLKFLEEKYADQIAVIGVHAAKFDNEKRTENIREAILRYEIAHPVVNDAEMIIARKYAFNSWPTLVVIDPEGNFVGRVSGEGHRELLDHVIGQMIAFHRAKGTLDETPLRFHLERDRRQAGPFQFPGKLIADETGGRLFISDSNHNRIVIASLDGKLLDVVGDGAMGATDGDFAAARFDHPQGMVLVGQTLYVADTENHLIRTVDLRSRTVGTLAGTGEQARLRTPGGELRATPLNSPWDLTHLGGTLYIAMAGPHQLWKHRLGSPTIEVLAGSGREDILDGPLETCALAQPSGITHDGTVLYHVDSEGSAVRRVSIAPGGTVTTLVGPHDLPHGASLFEFGDVDGVGDAVRLQHPLGIVHHEGALYVADTYNHKIKRIDIAARRCETWLGTGERGAGLDPVQLNEPAGLAIVGERLFIADTNNHRILIAHLQTKQVTEFTVAGLTPPHPPRSTPADDGDLAAAELPPHTVRSGQPLSVVLRFTLPEGYKLNPLTKVLWKLEAVGEAALIPADQLGVRQEAQGEELSATFELPVAAAGAGTYDLTVTWQYCREGAGGVCKLGRTKVRLPLTADPAAPIQPLTLTIAP